MMKPAVCVAALVVATGQAQAFDRDLQNAAGAAAGIVGSIYVHELGHALALQLGGATDIAIHVPGPQCRLLCGSTTGRPVQPLAPGEARWFNAAGFLAANAVSEGLLGRRSLATSGIGQGYIAANLYSNVAHVYTYYTKRVGVDGYRGNDIDGFEAAGGNPHLLNAALVGYSLYTLKRMHDRQIPLLYARIPF